MANRIHSSPFVYVITDYFPDLTIFDINGVAQVEHNWSDLAAAVAVAQSFNT